ncbi:hypothetical protein GGR53DRAFT_504046 [Hypoxylon sp. FL1150]|nr:hypothetical protein GGR53DRAFT_504046 [Hypoxylon sp. FL1150]
MGQVVSFLRTSWLFCADGARGGGLFGLVTLSMRFHEQMGGDAPGAGGLSLCGQLVFYAWSRYLVVGVPLRSSTSRSLLCIPSHACDLSRSKAQDGEGSSSSPKFSCSDPSSTRSSVEEACSRMRRSCSAIPLAL